MSKQVSVVVDASKATGKLRHTWNYIGYDECNYTTSPGGRELLQKFGNLSDGPFFVRPHHLLCTGNTMGEYKWGSTNVYTEDENGNPVYDFTTLDAIMDALLETGNKPFFEIGFMPRDLADTRAAENPEKGYAISPWKTNKDYQRLGWKMPPKDYQKWYDLIHAIITHFVERYGVEEINSWYFEMWNEPQGAYYWNASYEEFYKLYDYTEKAVHDALPTALFGGPAVVRPRRANDPATIMLDEFLAHCRSGKNYVTGETGTRLDYLTWHVKGGGYRFTTTFVKQIPSVKSFVEQNRTAIEVVKKYGYENLEVVLSEADPDGWAAGGRFDNLNLNFRNTEYYATYVASSYKNTYDLAEGAGMDIRPQAWAFMFDNERCFEGTRVFSTQGIDKAVFNLFKLYAKLGEDRLALTSSQDLDPLTYEDDYGTGQPPEIDGWATKKDDGSIQALVYSHHDDWDEKGDTEINLTFANVSGEYQIRHYRIDQEHSNAYAEWMRQGCPDYPVGEQYAAIKARDGLELLTPPAMTQASGELKLGFSLPFHGISMIELTPKK